MYQRQISNGKVGKSEHDSSDGRAVDYKLGGSQMDGNNGNWANNPYVWSRKAML